MNRESELLRLSTWITTTYNNSEIRKIFAAFMGFDEKDFKKWRDLFFDWLVDTVHAKNKHLSIREIKTSVREVNKILKEAANHEKELQADIPPDDL